MLIGLLERWARKNKKDRKRENMKKKTRNRKEYCKKIKERERIDSWRSIYDCG